jgi:hypothetical protein
MQLLRVVFDLFGGHGFTLLSRFRRVRCNGRPSLLFRQGHHSLGDPVEDDGQAGEKAMMAVAVMAGLAPKPRMAMEMPALDRHGAAWSGGSPSARGSHR